MRLAQSSLQRLSGDSVETCQLDILLLNFKRYHMLLVGETRARPMITVLVVMNWVSST